MLALLGVQVYLNCMSLKTIEPIRLLETSQFIQDQLTGLGKIDASRVWNEHRSLLGSDPSLAGTKHVHMRTETAMMLPDGLNGEEAVYPILQYGELAFRGYLADVKMVHFKGSATVMWMMCDAILRDIHLSVLELSDETNDSELVNPLPVGIPVRRPLYAPAKLIDFALPAA
jgi:hypothetical protein